MAYTFDSLGYAKKLRDGGVPQEQAEAHAEAARDFIMVELATKADLLVTEQKLRTSITELQTDLRMTEQRLQTSISDVQTEFRTTRQELQTELRTSIEAQSLRLTVRLGVLIAAGIGALAAILKLA
jgi:hypothetical protein